MTYFDSLTIWAQKVCPENNEISLARIAWYNCAGGLVAKIDSIKFILQTNDFDIFFISETEIKRVMDPLLFSIKGYRLVVSGSLSVSGIARTAFYYKENLDLFKNETIGLGFPKMVAMGIYRQFKLNPGSSHSAELNSLLKNLNSVFNQNADKHLIVGGDFNVDWNRKMDVSYHNRSLLYMVEEWMDLHTFAQLVTFNTRNRDVINIRN